MPGRMPSHHKQHGVALVLVLWVLLLLTIITGTFALLARMDRLEANTLLSSTQARLGAEAALNLAVLSLRDPDDELRMRADGRVYQQTIEGVRLEVSAVDERGKLDINAAGEQALTNLFIGQGMEADAAEQLAAAVEDWRDPDELERVNGAEKETYEAAGLPVGPANRPFMTTEELLQVIGMTFDFYRKLEPAITVYSHSSQPDPAFAPVEAMMALPDITHDEAVDFVKQRNSLQPGDELGAALPNGVVVREGGRGITFSITARATMPNGVWDELRATIRLGATRTGKPYHVLSWHEGFQYD